MSEPMSDARLAEIRDLAANAFIYDDYHRITRAVPELLAELDRLRARPGRDWGDAGGVDHRTALARRHGHPDEDMADEATARANLAYEPADDFHRDVQVSAKPHLMRRLAGEWREDEQ